MLKGDNKLYEFTFNPFWDLSAQEQQNKVEQNVFQSLLGFIRLMRQNDILMRAIETFNPFWDLSEGNKNELPLFHYISFQSLLGFIITYSCGFRIIMFLSIPFGIYLHWADEEGRVL